MASQDHQHDFWEDLFANWLPRTHLYAAGLVALLLVVFLVLTPSKPVSAFKEKAPGNYGVAIESVGQSLNAKLDDAIKKEAEQPALVQHYQLDETVRRGDSLSKIFKRLSLSQRDVFAVANAAQFSSELKRLNPGETISVVLSPNNQIKEVVYERSKLESYRYTPSDNGYRGEQLSREAETVIGFRDATINHSLFLDGEKAGLSHAHIMHIANIFAWDIDFALDIRKGDTFSVLFEDKYVDGEKIGSGTILGAEFTTQGRTYKAVRYEDIDGNTNYYSPEGRPMKKAFLRAPLDFTRVSSNYNPNRLHPIFKTRKPHRGVDYAAPAGTPVYSAGDGKVTKSGYSSSSGNYVVVQHGGAYTTKYLHLKRRLVKTGQSVRQRQAIGSVGSTGYATGPHLHYEFLVNGTHTNPRTVKLPQAEPISKHELARFKLQTAPLLAQLQSYQTPQLAAFTTTNNAL